VPAATGRTDTDEVTKTTGFGTKVPSE
jgi:hypothetical protein